MLSVCGCCVADGLVSARVTGRRPGGRFGLLCVPGPPSLIVHVPTGTARGAVAFASCVVSVNVADADEAGKPKFFRSKKRIFRGHNVCVCGVKQNERRLC